MEIRAGTTHDIESVREIWRLCFGNDAFCDWFFSRLYTPEYLRVVTVNETVVSMAFCFPREICFQDGIKTAWYLYGVGTHPASRGKGYARCLIEACVSEASAQSVDLCFLIPAEQSLFSYYKRIGFSEVWTNSKTTNQAAETQLRLETRPIFECDIELIDKIYLTAFPASVCRKKSDWELLIEEFRLSSGDGALIYENGQLLGYMFFYEKELALCEDVDAIRVCHAICKVSTWELTRFGDETPFALAYPLSKDCKIEENIYCDLLYN